MSTLLRSHHSVWKGREDYFRMLHFADLQLGTVGVAVRDALTPALYRDVKSRVLELWDFLWNMEPLSESQSSLVWQWESLTFSGISNICWLTSVLLVMLATEEVRQLKNNELCKNVNVFCTYRHVYSLQNFGCMHPGHLVQNHFLLSWSK